MNRKKTVWLLLCRSIAMIISFISENRAINDWMVLADIVLYARNLNESYKRRTLLNSSAGCSSTKKLYPNSTAKSAVKLSISIKITISSWLSILDVRLLKRLNSAPSYSMDENGAAHLMSEIGQWSAMLIQLSTFKILTVCLENVRQRLQKKVADFLMVVGNWCDYMPASESPDFTQRLPIR